MGNPKLIVDGGVRTTTRLPVLDENKTVLVRAYNDVSANPVEIVAGKTVTFFPFTSNASITLTFRGANPFGWGSNTMPGVQGTPLTVTGPAGSYRYEARLSTGSVSANPDPKLIVK